MPQPAGIEAVVIGDRQINVRWKSTRLGEWLAWCYVPATSQLHSEGVGFEARAPTPEAAKEACLEQARAHLAQSAATEANGSEETAGAPAAAS